jgi:hypothetical protein
VYNVSADMVHYNLATTFQCQSYRKNNLWIQLHAS